MSISKEELEVAIAEGKTLTEIAYKHNITKQWVSILAKRYNIPIKKSGGPIESYGKYPETLTVRLSTETYNILKTQSPSWIRNKLNLLAQEIVDHK